MHIPKMRLYRMGSDPEALFARPVDFDWTITPAFEILGRDKKKTTTSFIGTDSRPVLAEIRPNPARNLKRHLYEIAYAVTTTQDYLDSSAKWKGLKLLAYPHLHDENLGGHIHASMFIDDPLYLRLKKCGYTMGSFGQGLAVYPGGEPSQQRNKDLEVDAANAIQHDDVVLPHNWGLALSWLLNPFETWVQPWVPREKRNSHYGAEQGVDCVRLGVSKAPFDLPGWAYVHWEYRLPSTWLQHPRLAYAYLGLAKLAVLNMPAVYRFWQAEVDPKKKRKVPTTPSSMLDPPTGEAPTQFRVIKSGDPGEAGVQFQQRFQKLLALARVSKDLHPLPHAVAWCAQQRAVWCERPTPVDVEAWRRLL